MKQMGTGVPNYKRLISLFLCISMLTGLFHMDLANVYARETAPGVTITYNDEEVKNLTVSQSERTEVEAVCTKDTGDVSYQWQILADIDAELWVDIYDGTKRTLTLSYALLASLLDASGSVYIRCEATADGVTGVSEPVGVTVAFDVPTDETSLNSAALQTMEASAEKAENAAIDSYSADDMISISVNYLDAVSGLAVYTGFSAQIEKGTAYSNTVISPTYLGYAPYYNKSNPATTIPKDGEVVADDNALVVPIVITEDYAEDTYTVNVYYKAIDVPYAARYYFQNINDDFYTEDVGLYHLGTAKTGTIISNEKLAEAVDSERQRGFTKLYHYPEAVAADGSTVFECYYDRNYRMLKFDLDGGYGTEPIYARYGTPFLVNTPTRHGYAFGGWDLIINGEGDGIADTMPDMVPDENRTYCAIWKSVEAGYTEVYWLRNATCDDYDYVGSQHKTAQSGSVVSGSADVTKDTIICGEDDASHVHSDSCKPALLRFAQFDHADKNVEVDGDGSTVVNVYYIRKEYTLRFYYAKEYNPDRDNEKKDENNITEVTYSIIGGSTYKFGHQFDGVYNTAHRQYKRPVDSDGNVLNDIESLLYNVSHSEWGTVEAIPEIHAPDGVEYTKGVYPSEAESTNGGYTNKGDKFYYFEFTAPYGADLTKYWPSEVFDRIPVTGKRSNGAENNTSNDGWGNYAYFAGWNGEYNVQYNWDNTNATIKCYYPVLNEKLLYSTRFIEDFGDPTTINFLAFFDNGANVSWSVPRQWIYELYLPLLPGETAESTRVYNGVTYKLYNTVYANDDNDGKSGLGNQTCPPLPGFSAATASEWLDNGYTEDGRHSNIARYYYKRLDYTLVQHNFHMVYLQESVPYQTEIDAYNAATPPYPSTLEENAYMFDGWYYSPGCYDGSEYQVGTTMPAHDVSLYAKWTPVSHTVRFFQTYDDMLEYEKTGKTDGLIEEKSIAHGNVLGNIDNPIDKSPHHYSFGGWFYMKSGVKTAFTPLDMPVTRELNVFADWGSLQAQPYIIHYTLLETEDDPGWEALLIEKAGEAPVNNIAYSVTKDGETRSYVYLSEDGGFHLEIADASSGFAYQGNTRTFYPKAGNPFNQLYSDYNDGYFPTVASHSITIEYEENKEEPGKNVFTFTYVHATNIDYRVEYRYQDTGELITTAADGGTVTKTTSKAVVTERFVVVTDYIPDAFYKRLILAVEKDENGSYVGSKDNVITFYYTKNETNAYYAVHHMLQNADALSEAMDRDANGNYVNYTESSAHTEGIGRIGTTIKIEPQSFSGFTVQDEGIVRENGTDEQNITLNGSEDGHSYFEITVKQEGTELYVFYKRNTQNYRVYYLRYGTDISKLSELEYDASDESHANGVLAETLTETGKYQTAVTATAIEIVGMNCVSALKQTIVLRPNDAQNYIIFYYSPLQFTVEYRVWKYGGGTLDNTMEVKDGNEGYESYKGSLPTAHSGYTFEGWYLDPDCTVSAVSDPASASDKAVVTGDRLTPVASNLDAMPKTNVFYAKFMPELGDLTITRENGAADEGAGDRVYVYKITAKDDPTVVTYATITGNGSVTVKDLGCREYIVEQQNDWSWRYGDTEKSVTVTKNGHVSVTFSDAPVKNAWLSGGSNPVKNRKE